jgi:hypothetical protein
MGAFLGMILSPANFADFSINFPNGNLQGEWREITVSQLGSTRVRRLN